MLETQERRLFLDALQPPLGYELDYIIGTTYSLDILALMTVPLSFSLVDWQDNEGRPSMNPLALLESMRRYADKMTLFCQAGMIKVPKRHRAIFTYTEDSIVEVKAPNENGVFHPKVWVTRYVSKNGPVRYKVIIQSRNLTFDRSWDMMLVLDGELTTRKNAFSKNHPIGDFIKTLPTLAVHHMSDERLEILDEIQSEIRRVQFQIPGPFDQDQWVFWPLGIEGYHRWPFSERRDRTLVVSPFISGSILQRIGEKGKNHLLVTRVEELSAISKEYKQDFEKIYVLQEASLPEPDEHNVEESGQNHEEKQDDMLEPLTSTPENEGLHAKMYIADQGWDASVWLGSANATSHAFSKNVEFLVQLRGKKSKCGIDAFLGDSEKKGSFIQLLQEYNLEKHEIDEEALEKEKLEKVLEAIRIKIASAKCKVYVEEIENKMFSLHLEIPALSWDDGVKINCWPLSMKEQFEGVSLSKSNESQNISFGPVDTLGITSFFIFSLYIPYKNEEITSRFLCNFPIFNVPEDRKEQILHSMLKKKEQFLRYLALLLSDGGINISDMDALLQSGRMSQSEHGGSSYGAFPLFEMMMKALTRNPEQLDQIHDLIIGLKKTEEGRSLLPDEFDSIWDPIWTVRKGQLS
jgi:hypothetical protein